MITILQGGHHCFHPNNFSIIRPNGLPIYLFLLIKSPAFIELNNEKIIIKPNTIILFDKNTYIHYGSSHTTYVNDWIRFDILDEPKLLSLLQIPFNTPIYLSNTSYLSTLIHLMIQKRNLPRSNLHQTEILNHLMHTLLLHLDEQLKVTLPKVNPKYYDSLNDLRNYMLTHLQEKWSIETMAHTVHLSTSYFQTQYKQLFGCTCMQDIINARLDQAKFYLVNTDMSVYAIAKCCGYENEVHFMRQFKKSEGMTPSDFRKLFYS